MKSFTEFTTESANSLLKKVLAKIPKDSKKKKDGGVCIYATGNLAVALGVKDYEDVKVSDITDDQLNKLAKLFKVEV